MTWSFTDKWSFQLTLLWVLILGTVVVRLLALNQTAYANGWDGYYYVMQAHSWLTYGHMQSQDYSLIYPYFTSLAFFTGDYIFAFKVGSAILAGCLSASVAWLIYTVRQQYFPVLLVLGYLLFSPTVTYLVVQFPKNVMGLTCMMCFLTMLHKRQPIGSIVFFVLTLLSHRMTAGLVMIVLLIYGFQFLPKRWVVIALVVAGLLSLLPGVFHFSDLQRLDGMFLFWPQFAPWSFYQLFQPTLSLWWKAELIGIVLIFCYLIFTYIYGRQWRSDQFLLKWCFPLLIGIALFPFMTMDNGSLGYRFFMVAPIFLVVYLGLMTSLSNNLVIGLSLILTVGGIFSYKSYQPLLHDPPNQLYELITKRLTRAFSPKEYPRVIVHKSLAEMIIYKTEFDALNWAPPKTWSLDSTLRIVKGLTYMHFSKYLSGEELAQIKKLTLHYYAMTESNWKVFLDRIEKQQDQELMDRIRNTSNPLDERPVFLKKSKEGV